MRLAAPTKRRNSAVGAKLSLRSWVALFLQERRRKRAGGSAPVVPVFTGSSWEWDITEPGWVDVGLNFSLDQAVFPAGELEVWFHKEGMAPAVMLDTIASTDTGYTHAMATQAQEFLFYQLRYVGDGSEAVSSNELTIFPYRMPAAPVITDGSYQWGATEEWTADVLLHYSFDQGALPVATLEVWWHNGGDYVLLATTPSDGDSFLQRRAAFDEAALCYKMRYVNGLVVGPFSAEFEVDVMV